jgi:hypothetical protein
MGCVAVIAVADYVIQRKKPSWILVGMFDHPAHVATAVLILLNLPERDPGWTKAYLAGSLLPDLDHIPLVLRPVKPSLDDPRPVSHCLLAVAPFAAVSKAAAAGMLAHFARDVGVGTGVPLLWPATRRSFRIPYAGYAAACLILARRATLVDGL